MKYRLLWLIPLGFASLFWVGFFFFSDQSWYATYARIEVMLAKLLSLAAYLIAAVSFRKGEYLRRGWLWLAACMAMFLTSDVFFISPLPLWMGDTVAVPLQGLVVGLGNLFLFIGVLIVARAWGRAGLDDSEHENRKWFMTLVAVCVGLIVVGPAVVTNLIGLLEGKVDSSVVIGIVSGVGTTAALSMVAGLLRTVRALGDTNLRWPWMFLSLVLLSWLGFDGIVWWGPRIGISATCVTCLQEIFRIFACTFGVSAGLAQRFLQQEIRMSRRSL